MFSTDFKTEWFVSTLISTLIYVTTIIVISERSINTLAAVITSMHVYHSICQTLCFDVVIVYAKGKGSLTTRNDKGKIDVSSEAEGPSTGS